MHAKIVIPHSSIAKVSSAVLKWVENIIITSGKIDRTCSVYLGARCIIVKQTVHWHPNIVPSITKAAPRLVLDKLVVANAHTISTFKINRIANVILI